MKWQEHLDEAYKHGQQNANKHNLIAGFTGAVILGLYQGFMDTPQGKEFSKSVRRFFRRLLP